MASIELRSVSVRCGEDRRTVLDSIDLDISYGSISLLLGANGSGKTVLLRTILGLFPTIGGTITLDGVVLKRPFTRLHRMSGVCFQNSNVQIFGETVREDIEIGRAPITSDDEPVLDAFGIGELLDLSPSELSGGQLRRVALAGAFLRKPRFLFLDEPFLELDYPHIVRTVDQIDSARRRGVAVVITSHETRDIWEVLDRVTILERGRVVFCGSPADAISEISPSIGLRPFSDDTPHRSGNGVYDSR